MKRGDFSDQPRLDLVRQEAMERVAEAMDKDRNIVSGMQGVLNWHNPVIGKWVENLENYSERFAACILYWLLQNHGDFRKERK